MESARPLLLPLHIAPWSPRPPILPVAQEERLFKVAAGYPEAHMAYCCATITNNTTASGMELRGLKLKDICLNPSPDISYFHIREGKNEERIRTVPMNPAADWAFRAMKKRALRLGSTDPEHYLFPFRKRDHSYDPTRPPTRWFLQNS